VNLGLQEEPRPGGPAVHLGGFDAPGPGDAGAGRGSRGRLVIGLVAFAALAGAAALWATRAPPSAAAVPDAGAPVAENAQVPVATAAPRFEFPEDAGEATREPEGQEAAIAPAGPEEGGGASPFTDAGAGAAANTVSVRITSTPPAEVVLDKRSLGRAPVAVELEPGAWVVRLVNRAENFQRTIPFTLEPGERRRTIASVAQKGTLRLNARPYAAMALNGRSITATQVSFREVELWEGTYTVSFELTDAALPKPRRLSRVVTVRPGENPPVEVNLLE
jgi:hypothetical protein